MKDKNELLSEMEKAMDRYDLSKEIEKARIGEWMYGVAMVPCDWVYEYVKQPEIIRCKDCKYMIDTGDDLMCDNAKGWVVATASDFGCVLAERRTE